ncbi:MAG: histidine ammonia-lyase, partial [Lachnospiraceae bacterium]
LEGSTYTTRQGELRVQDAYSIRCVPQIHGASKDSIAYVEKKVEIELNSVTDNPIVTREGDVISGGNFHGEPMAQPFDFLGIGIAEIANVSERRLERLINPQLNDLPAFLTPQGGLNSGYMITQYACAALVSENKILAHPASVDSIPSSANQEDLVSMGTIAARTARDILVNSVRVLATELMAACQAIDFRKDLNLKLGKGTQKAYDAIRAVTDFIKLDTDIEMYKELDKVTKLIVDGTILEAVEAAVELNY